MESLTNQLSDESILESKKDVSVISVSITKSNLESAVCRELFEIPLPRPEIPFKDRHTTMPLSFAGYDCSLHFDDSPTMRWI
jgi:hypothetical protein